MKGLTCVGIVLLFLCCSQRQQKSVSQNISSKPSNVVTQSTKDSDNNTVNISDNNTDNKNVKSPLYIYINNRYYKQSTIINIENENIGKYDIITNAFIEPNKDNNIDYEKLKNRVIKLFPEEDKEVLILIDWETKVLFGLKKEQGSDRFENSVKEFIKVTKYVKSLRPNFKVGIYGLPFKMNNDAQMSKLNDGNNKFDEIFKNVDFIAPSLYLDQLDKNSLSKKNKDIIVKTLGESFKYANRLKKPVIPFVWYRIHPKNKKDGLKVLSVQMMEQYLTEIAHFSKEGNKVSGLIWWEPSIDVTTDSEIRQLLLNTENIKMNNKEVSSKRERVLIEYSKIFNKIK